MFGLGMPEILLILAIALIVIGPKKLPDLAKTLGRAMGEFKRSAQDFKRSIDIETTVGDSVKDVPPAKDLKEVIKEVNQKSDEPDGKKTEKSPGTDTSEPDNAGSPEESETSGKSDAASEPDAPFSPDTDRSAKK